MLEAPAVGVRLLIIAGAVYGLTRVLAHPRAPWRTLDMPNDRSLHSTPVPRTGGLAILAGLVLAAVLFAPWPTGRDGFLAAALAGIALISWWDDRISLSPLVRLMTQIVAACVAVIWGGVHWSGPVWPGFSPPLPLALREAVSIVYLVWCMNLYNFMDGMDGLAGGMAVIGFGALAVLGMRAGAPEFALIGGAVSMAALGFTASNFPPARLFMGDAGSIPLGFLFGIMTLAGSARGVAPLWVGILIFSPFFVDATVTLLRRIMRGENPARAHREHYYQRLVLGGLTHKRVVLFEYVLMTACAISAWWAVGGSDPEQWAIIAIWVCTYAAVAHIIDRWRGCG